VTERPILLLACLLRPRACEICPACEGSQRRRKKGVSCCVGEKVRSGGCRCDWMLILYEERRWLCSLQTWTARENPPVPRMSPCGVSLAAFSCLHILLHQRQRRPHLVQHCQVECRPSKRTVSEETPQGCAYRLRGAHQRSHAATFENYRQSFLVRSP